MERIGYTIAQMHGPVPLWHKEIEFSVNKLVISQHRPKKSAIRLIEL